MTKQFDANEKIELWPGTPPGFDVAFNQPMPTITPYIIDSPRSAGAVIVFPGGGYSGRAPHEKEPIARWFNQIGLNAFVLDYRVAPYRHPIPLQDAQRAIRFVRANASKWRIDPSRIAILGFSAGGHLAACAATMSDDNIALPADEIDKVSARPDAAILCYPVVTFGEFRHDGSMVNLLGENPPEELRRRMSVENAVTDQSPPMFIWTTADDQAVPMENSLLMANALRRNSVPFSLHVFPTGRHGLALAADCPDVGQWTKLCDEWLRKLGF